MVKKYLDQGKSLDDAYREIIKNARERTNPLIDKVILRDKYFGDPP
jgi:hypothetical protein